MAVRLKLGGLCTVVSIMKIAIINTVLSVLCYIEIMLQVYINLTHILLVANSKHRKRKCIIYKNTKFAVKMVKIILYISHVLKYLNENY